jgi:hypothetical protein
MSTVTALSTRRPRSVDPYRDLDVIDRNGPRTNQAVIGTLALVAVLTGAEWLIAVLAAQLMIGLTFGRQYCLPCLLYFEVIQPRIGEGPLEDARAPRFANMIGASVLGAATILFVLGFSAPAWILAGLVAVLALLAATTGFCLGCAIYRRIWGCEVCET